MDVPDKKDGLLPVLFVLEGAPPLSNAAPRWRNPRDDTSGQCATLPGLGCAGGAAEGSRWRAPSAATGTVFGIALRPGRGDRRLLPPLPGRSGVRAPFRWLRAFALATGYPLMSLRDAPAAPEKPTSSAGFWGNRPFPRCLPCPLPPLQHPEDPTHDLLSDGSRRLAGDVVHGPLDR